MDEKDYELLHALDETRNITHAADKLYMTQSALSKRIKALEQLALRQGQTQQFIETPYRNPALWQALLQHLQPNTRLALASGLTLGTARIASHTVREWRQRSLPAPDSRTPVVFSIGR